MFYKVRKLLKEGQGILWKGRILARVVMALEPWGKPHEPYEALEPCLGKRIGRSYTNSHCFQRPLEHWEAERMLPSWETPKQGKVWLGYLNNQDNQWYSVENSPRLYWVKGCMNISLVVVAHTTETVRKGLTSVLFCEVCRLQGSLSIKRLDLSNAQELKKYLS